VPQEEDMRIKFIFILITLFSSVSSAQDFFVKEVRFKNIVANLYLPNTSEKVPVVIAIGGSEGGISTGDANGKMIAPHGIAVLGLAYFKEKGIAQTLDQIPLEYFLSAIDYLETVSSIDSSKIGFIGGSRGAELALLLASKEPRIKSVVATTPSKVAWYGMTTARSAWTFNGKDIPALSLELDEKAPLLNRFEVALENKDNVANSLFSFEKINGPILLISAKNDQVWPSFQMSNEIEEYLKKHNFKHSVTHNAYPTGHGFSQETAPEIKQSIIDHFMRTL
ncbi:acyl-CoA thioester hydrolase/BAAT C-terminal domain-containing protein, partial [Pseudoalteromonas sp. APC 3224]|uniref:alpha/beta hydrolase family protein n=1 Tax=Pseudoalteromonas sp. APC 3224 TaxID=3035203 RepID=UPI0025B4CB9F